MAAAGFSGGLERPDFITLAEQAEIRSLKGQVKRLEMEREILKKATVFFAKETK
jgi:transposase-like protein